MGVAGAVGEEAREEEAVVVNLHCTNLIYTIRYNNTKKDLPNGLDFNLALSWAQRDGK